MTLKELHKLVGDALERGEDPNATMLDGEPEGFVYNLAYVPILNFGFARFTADSTWEKCEADAPGAEAVAWLE